MTYAERFQLALDQSKLSRPQLARELGVSAQAIGEVLKGATRSLSAENNSKAARILGVSSDWLATGHDQMNMSNVAAAPALGASRLIPVVGHVKGGEDGFLEEMQYPVGHGEGFVQYWTKDPKAYALRVKGESMHPRYRAREFIVVTPSIEAQPGNDVVVKLKDGRKLLKQLNRVHDDEIQLVSINDGYEPTTIQSEEIEDIHRVGGGVPPDALIEG